MRRTRETRWLLCAFSLACAPWARAQSVPADSLGWWGPQQLAAATDSLRLAPGQVRVDLRHGFLVRVDSIRVDGSPRFEGEDVTVELNGGFLLLAQPAVGGELLRVRYHYHPASLRAEVVLHQPRPTGPRAPPPSRPPDPTGANLPPPDLGALTISGSKSVSVQGGSNREATVDQALRLSVSGELARGIGVRAEISDENLPITPEGNTEELSDLDQVRIELFGPRGRAVLGDFATESTWGEFVPYQRKLQGVWLHGRVAGSSLALLAGSPRGRRVEVEIRGREGVQGPYELLDGRRLNQSFIVADTERVWVDGERMVRGEDRHYVMDYVRGTIRFTETRPVDPDSRIAVDFETSESSYSQTVVGARADSLAVGPVRVHVALLRESDDDGRPTDGSLSAADRDSLAGAGDDPDQALGTGVVGRTDGMGRYVEMTDQGVVFYEFSPETEGDVDVSFVRVETGDYELDGVDADGRAIFRYVGPGLGEYVVGRTLGLPSRTQVAVLRFDLADAGARFLRGELDVSDQDRNTLSSRDDGDNQGLAYRVAGSSGWVGGDDEGVRLGGLLELLGENYTSLGRLRSPFFYEAWNLQDDLRERAEDRQEAVLELARGARRVDVGLERLHRRDRFTGRRVRSTGAGPVWGRLGWTHRLAFLDATRSGGLESRRTDRVAELRSQTGRVRPRVSVFDEEFTDRRVASVRGFRSAGWSAGAAVGDGPRTLDLQFRRAVADSLTDDANPWKFARDSRGWTGRARATTDAVTVDLDVNLRRTHLPAGKDETTRLARVRAARRPIDSWWGADLEYRAGTDASRILAREVVFVGLNEGDFDAEGNPVGARQGDYNVIFTPSDSLVQSTEVELRTSVDLTPDASFAGGVASRTLLQVRERNRGDDVGAVLRLDPSVLLDNDATVFGEQRLREELQLLRQLRRVDLRLTLDTVESVDQRFAGGAERSHRRTRQARMETQVRRGLVTRVLVGDERRDRSAPPSANPLLASYRVRDRFLALTGRLQPTPRSRTALELRVTDREETQDGLAQTILEVKPSATVDLLRARWTADLRWAQIQEEAGEDPLRPVFFERPGSTRSAAVTTQWSVGANFTVLLRYQVRDEPDRELRQDLGVETRARF